MQNKEQVIEAGGDSPSEKVPDGEQGVVLDTAWETIEASLGTGDKRVILVTKPVTLNEIHRLAMRR